MTTHPAAFLLACVAAVPLVLVAATAGTTWWYERVWLPRIAGED